MSDHEQPEPTDPADHSPTPPRQTSALVVPLVIALIVATALAAAAGFWITRDDDADSGDDGAAGTVETDRGDPEQVAQAFLAAAAEMDVAAACSHLTEESRDEIVAFMATDAEEFQSGDQFEPLAAEDVGGDQELADFGNDVGDDLNEGLQRMSEIIDGEQSCATMAEFAEISMPMFTRMMTMLSIAFTQMPADEGGAPEDYDMVTCFGALITWADGLADEMVGTTSDLVERTRTDEEVVYEASVTYEAPPMEAPEGCDDATGGPEAEDLNPLGEFEELVVVADDDQWAVRAPESWTEDDAA